MEHDIMTLKEAAEFMGVSQRILICRMTDGLPYFQLRKYGLIRFSRSDINRFLEEINSTSNWLDRRWEKILRNKFEKPDYIDPQNMPRSIPSWVRRATQRDLRRIRELERKKSQQRALGRS